MDTTNKCQQPHTTAPPLKKYAGALIFALALALYLSAPERWWSGDTLPSSYLPISILEHGTLYLDYFHSLYGAKASKTYHDGANPLPYYLTFVKGHYVSGYSPWPAFMAIPIYAVPVLAHAPLPLKSILFWAKLSAAMITAFSVLFLFWALREIVSVGWATVIALVYAFGTSAFSINSRAFYEHGPSVFFLTLGLFFLIKGEKNDSTLPFAGLCFSAAVLMRYTDALIALPVCFYVFHKYRNVFVRYLYYSSPPAFLLLAYNHWYLGSVWNTGYFQLGSRTANNAWSTPFWQGFSGLLFSPSRGLFIYSPILLMSLVGIWLVWRRGPISLRYLSIGIFLVVLLISKWFMWWGGYGYGPRLLAGIAPLLCFFLYPLGQIMRKRSYLLSTFVLLAGLSISMNAIGAYWYDGQWDAQESVRQHPQRLWSWKNSPFVYYAHYPYWDISQLTRDVGIHGKIKAVVHGMLSPFHSSKKKTALPIADRSHSLRAPLHFYAEHIDMSGEFVFSTETWSMFAAASKVNRTDRSMYSCKDNPEPEALRL